MNRLMAYNKSQIELDIISTFFSLFQFPFLFNRNRIEEELQHVEQFLFIWKTILTCFPYSFLSSHSVLCNSLWYLRETRYLIVCNWVSKGAEDCGCYWTLYREFYCDRKREQLQEYATNSYSSQAEGNSIGLNT